MSDQHEEGDAVEVEEVTAEHVDVDASSESHAAGSALALRAPTREVLMPMDTETVIQGMDLYQEMLPKLLKDSDWQDAGRDGKFVKKSGWRKIARAFNLSVVKVSEKVERDLNGEVLRAEAVYRAIAPNGQMQDGDGYCAREESRFAKESGRAKLENDLRATATTRAKNRAISDLVGMGEVSAEEMSPGGAGGAAPAATQDQVDILFRALMWLFEDDEKQARDSFGHVERACGGTITTQAVDAVVLVLGARKKGVAPAEEASSGKAKSDKKSKSRESKEAKQRRERKERADAAAVKEEEPDEHPPEPGADEAPDDLPPA